MDEKTDNGAFSKTITELTAGDAVKIGVILYAGAIAWRVAVNATCPPFIRWCRKKSVQWEAEAAKRSQTK